MVGWASQKSLALLLRHTVRFTLWWTHSFSELRSRPSLWSLSGNKKKLVKERTRSLSTDAWQTSTRKWNWNKVMFWGALPHYIIAPDHIWATCQWGHGVKSSTGHFPTLNSHLFLSHSLPICSPLYCPIKAQKRSTKNINTVLQLHCLLYVFSWQAHVLWWFLHDLQAPNPIWVPCSMIVVGWSSEAAVPQPNANVTRRNGTRRVSFFPPMRPDSWSQDLTYFFISP